MVIFLIFLLKVIGINNIKMEYEHLFLLLIEFQSKEKIIEELDTLVHQYNNLHLKIRENNEKIKRKLDKVIVQSKIKIKLILLGRSSRRRNG